MTAVAPFPAFRPPRHFANGEEWLASLGGVPLSRVIFDSWPGTATEADLLRFVERDKRLCELIDGTLVEKPEGYWEGMIAVYHHAGEPTRILDERSMLDGEEVLPGLRIPVADLFLNVPRGE